jgi:inorganic pyrophosphatase
METIRINDKGERDWFLFPTTDKISDVYNTLKKINTVVEDYKILIKGHWYKLSSLKKYKELTIEEFK